MRKWWVPLLALGAGSVGAFFLTAKGRETVRGWWAGFEEPPVRWKEWNESAQLELERIQSTLNQISQSLESRSEQSSA
jgi:hypothetical protein